MGDNAAIPFASVTLVRFSPWLLAAIYAGLVGGLWLVSRLRSEAEAPLDCSLKLFGACPVVWPSEYGFDRWWNHRVKMAERGMHGE